MKFKERFPSLYQHFLKQYPQLEDISVDEHNSAVVMSYHHDGKVRSVAQDECSPYITIMGMVDMLIKWGDNDIYCA